MNNSYFFIFYKFVLLTLFIQKAHFIFEIINNVLLLFILFSQCLCKTLFKMVSSLQSSDLVVEKNVYTEQSKKEFYILWKGIVGIESYRTPGMK